MMPPELLAAVLAAVNYYLTRDRWDASPDTYPTVQGYGEVPR